MKLLDLFCGAGGCAMGYYRAGFTEVVGVDINPQKRYPFEFVQADALEYAIRYGHKFDMIHASPPCQVYSVTAALSNGNHPDLVGKTRDILLGLGKPYVIENVPGAPLINPITLCGTMFPGLRVIRHRLFECSPTVWWPPGQCQHLGNLGGIDAKINGKRVTVNLSDFALITVSGNGYVVADGKIAMGIDWMVGRELSQAIPPPYTEWLGGEMLQLIA
ncbi:MAG: DNA cytosine methyltransferase [Planctomycetaceae bacterium]|nr:DNA cytosine methyltransferase [Planctomycetaceae bacterium]